MPLYSALIRGIVSDPDTLQKLRPTEPSNPLAVIRIREATDGELSDARDIVNATIFPLVRGCLFYSVDALEEGLRIARLIDDDLGQYLQGMIHRRLCAFDLSRQCFRRVGFHPVFDQLHSAAAAVSPDMAKQFNWDPYLLVGMCEQERYGATRHRRELVQLQQIEFNTLLVYVWRKSVA